MDAESGPRHVLIVDDCRDTVSTITHVLGRWGHEVHAAPDGETALRMAADHQPDFILIDLSLPGISGYEAARRLRRMPDSDHVIIVAVSGYSAPECRVRAAQAGCDAYLTKPLDPERLREILVGGGVSQIGVPELHRKLGIDRRA